MVKISVIIPVYNVENYLEKCLNSLINQTLKDIEIICIDDGSTDSSLKILKKYDNIDKRVIIIQQKNKGAATSRNKGIDMANGEYISFVDSDDWLELDALEKLYDNATSNNSDLVLFNSIEQMPNNKIKERIYLPIDDSVNYNNFIFDYNYNKDLVMNKMFVVWSKIYKTSFLKDNNIKFHNHKIFNDVQFHIESMIFAKSISYLPEILYNYNKMNINSIQTSKSNKRLIIFKIFDEIEKFLIKHDLFDVFELNFLRFKLTESKANYERTIDEFKEEFYKFMRLEFIEMNINPKCLNKLPKRLYRFYIHILNFNTHEKFNTFYQYRYSFRYINKQKVQKKIDQFNNMGINNKRHTPQLIVSLTSYAERMYDVHFTIYSLLTQTLKPNKIILWLSQEDFPNKEKDLPTTLLNLKNNGLTISWCENIKSFKKLIPSLREYPNDIIVTADDDLYYPKDWLETLWKYYLKYPNSIISQRARRISLTENNNIKPYKEWPIIKDDVKESYLNLSTNGAGSLFPPNTFSDEIFNEKLFKKLSYSTDDIWFWTMAVLNHTKIKPIPNSNMILLKYINVSREIGLLDENTLWNKNMHGINDTNLKRIIDQFPEILDIINNGR